MVRETIGSSGSTAKVLDFTYDESGKPFALTYKDGTATPETYYYILNQQGDVVKLVEILSSGKNVQSYCEMAKYTYDAWGNVTATGSMAAINPLRYRGYYYDTETGFYYLQSRYYDPANHRFINADCFPTTNSTDAVSCNMFAYCLNNPVMGSDPKGNVPNINLMVTDGGGRAPKFYNNTALPDDDARYHINRLTASGIGVRRWCVEYSGKLNSTEGSNRKLLETAASVGLCIINKPLTSLAGIALPIISYYTNVCKITDEIPDGKYNAYIIKCYGYHDEGDIVWHKDL